MTDIEIDALYSSHGEISLLVEHFDQLANITTLRLTSDDDGFPKSVDSWAKLGSRKLPNTRRAVVSYLELIDWPPLSAALSTCAEFTDLELYIELDDDHIWPPEKTYSFELGDFGQLQKLKIRGGDIVVSKQFRVPIGNLPYLQSLCVGPPFTIDMEELRMGSWPNLTSCRFMYQQGFHEATLVRFCQGHSRLQRLCMVPFLEDGRRIEYFADAAIALDQNDLPNLEAFQGTFHQCSAILSSGPRPLKTLSIVEPFYYDSDERNNETPDHPDWIVDPVQLQQIFAAIEERRIRHLSIVLELQSAASILRPLSPFAAHLKTLRLLRRCRLDADELRTILAGFTTLNFLAFPLALICVDGQETAAAVSLKGTERLRPTLVDEIVQKALLVATACPTLEVLEILASSASIYATIQRRQDSAVLERIVLSEQCPEGIEAFEGFY